MVENRRTVGTDATCDNWGFKGSLQCCICMHGNLCTFVESSLLLLQVLGCAKGVLATAVSVLIFQNPVTVLGLGGYAMTVAGVFAYGYSKMKGR